ncbi:unnamed protein product [Chrysoparadoxa australica]
MLNALIYLFLREKRNVFLNKFALPLRLLSSLSSILLYYFATEAFAPKVESFQEMEGWTLFEFVIVGELTLFFVSDSLVIFGQQMRQIITSNSFDPLLNTKTHFFKTLFLMGISSYLISLITLIFEILVLTIFFKLNFSTLNVIKAVFLNLMWLPFFMAIGIFVASSLIIFKRGFGFFGSLVGLLGAVSGAYFPTGALPLNLNNYLKYINPFQLLVENTRVLIKTGVVNGSYLSVLLIGFLLGTLSLFISFLYLGRTITYYKRRGETLVFPTT